jgi:hypothetical protein
MFSEDFIYAWSLLRVFEATQIGEGHTPLLKLGCDIHDKEHKEVGEDFLKWLVRKRVPETGHRSSHLCRAAETPLSRPHLGNPGLPSAPLLKGRGFQPLGPLQ